MREFFLDENIIMPFKISGSIHLLCILSVIIGFVLIYKNKDKLEKMNENTKKKITLFIIITMFLNMKIYYIFKIIYGAYDWRIDLPFHFCFISGYLFMYSLLTKSHKLYKIVYFFAFAGPLPAILWPELKSTFDSFVFYQFYISHHFFLMANIFVFYTHNYKMGFNDVKRSFKIANFIFILVIIFNIFFNTNYIMHRKLPEHIIDLYPFLEGFNHPIIILELTGIIILALAYIPIYLKNREKTENNSLQLA